MIIFLYGENSFKINKKIQELKAKFIKEIDTSGQNIFKFDGENLKIQDISDKIANASLFCNKKMIIISNLIKNKTKEIFPTLLKYLDNNKFNSSSDIIIFSEEAIKSKSNNLLKTSSDRENPLNSNEKELYNFLKRQKYIQEFKNLTENELINFIQKSFKENNIKIDRREINLFISTIGNDLWTISSEIKKLSHFKLLEKDKKISSEDIKEMSANIFNENIFSFIDAVSLRNKKESLRILEEQYQAGSSPDYILSMLLRQFKILLQIRELLDLNYNSQKINSQLKMHPFIISKGINQSKNFKQDYIKKIITELSKIEIDNRKGLSNTKTQLNLLISKL